MEMCAAVSVRKQVDAKNEAEMPRRDFEEGHKGRIVVNADNLQK